MKVTRYGQDAYQLRKGHDPDWDLDVLVRTYSGGHITVSFRPGKDDTNAAWGPEITLDEAAVIPC